MTKKLLDVAPKPRKKPGMSTLTGFIIGAPKPRRRPGPGPEGKTCGACRAFLEPDGPRASPRGWCEKHEDGAIYIAKSARVRYDRPACDAFKPRARPFRLCGACKWLTQAAEGEPCGICQEETT